MRVSFQLWRFRRQTRWDEMGRAEISSLLVVLLVFLLNQKLKFNIAELLPPFPLRFSAAPVVVYSELIRTFKASIIVECRGMGGKRGETQKRKYKIARCWFLFVPLLIHQQTAKEKQEHKRKEISIRIEERKRREQATQRSFMATKHASNVIGNDFRSEAKRLVIQ